MPDYPAPPIKRGYSPDYTTTGASTVYVEVTFDEPFEKRPVVVVGLRCTETRYNYEIRAQLYSVSETGFTAYLVTNGAVTFGMEWIAYER